MKTTRRGFFRDASAVAASLPLASSLRASEIDTKSKNSSTEVPATLDLVERGNFAFNGLIGSMDWDKSSPEDYANIYGQGANDSRSAGAARLRRLSGVDTTGAQDRQSPGRDCRRQRRLHLLPDDAGIRDVFSYPRSGWKITKLLRKSRPNMADVPDDTFGIPMYLGGTILPVVRLAERLQNEKTLELATKLMRFLVLPDSAWLPQGYARGVAPAEHGVYRGHFHVPPTRTADIWPATSRP